MFKIFQRKFYGNYGNEWDKCWDIYFYIKCDSELRGSVQYSRIWSNMLIFGLDSDELREGTENGIWKLHDNPSKNNFLVRNLIINEHENEEDDAIIDEE